MSQSNMERRQLNVMLQFVRSARDCLAEADQSGGGGKPDGGIKAEWVAKPQGDGLGGDSSPQQASHTSHTSHTATAAWHCGPQVAAPEHSGGSVIRLLNRVAAVAPEMVNNDAYDMFVKEQGLLVVPVVDAGGRPLGLLRRYDMIEHFARPFQRELYGRRPCTVFMDPNPIIADKGTSLQELGVSMAQADPRHLSNGFIITDGGRYLGMGTGHDLMREITRMQICAARHANPLTQLPGNVPINDQIEQLLGGGHAFWACYVDLDHFKPFNDIYGYRKGDDVIQLAAGLLVQHCDRERDFIGHIGGDDFMVLFRSGDWERRCRTILDQFGDSVQHFYPPEDRERGGILAEDRQGKRMFHPLVSLSLGAIRVDPLRFQSHHQIASAAAEAKKQAKKLHGNSLFIERREVSG